MKKSCHKMFSLAHYYSHRFLLVALSSLTNQDFRPFYSKKYLPKCGMIGIPNTKIFAIKNDRHW